MRKSFRVGLRMGLLAGLIAAVTVALRSRRSSPSGNGSLATGVHGDWPAVKRHDGPAPDRAAVKAPPAPAPAPAKGVAPRQTAPGKAKAAAKRQPAAPGKVAGRATKAGKAATARSWVEAEGSVCPVSHPVKAKLSSGLFHLPGMVAYDRTTPDRCYRDAAEAEADGLTRAKR